MERHQTTVRIGSARRFRSLNALKRWTQALYESGFFYSVRSVRDAAGNVAEVTVTGKLDPNAQPFGAGSHSVERWANRASKPEVRKVRDSDGRERAWRGDAQAFFPGDYVKHRWDGVEGTVLSTSNNNTTVEVEWNDGTLTFHSNDELELA